MAATGFFVDWNGDTRRVECPGNGFLCGPVQNKMCDGEPYQAIDVIDTSGFVIHEAVYYPTLDALKASGVVINLILEPRSANPVTSGPG